MNKKEIGKAIVERRDSLHIDENDHFTRLIETSAYGAIGAVYVGLIFRRRPFHCGIRDARVLLVRRLHRAWARLWRCGGRGARPDRPVCRTPRRRGEYARGIGSLRRGKGTLSLPIP